jgi:hypothetical protein
MSDRVDVQYKHNIYFPWMCVGNGPGNCSSLSRPIRWTFMTKSICETCEHMREVISGTGSRFLLCRLSQADPCFPKYPPQPVLKCDGYNDRQPPRRSEA